MDLATEELRRSGLLVKLPRQPFKVLAIIAGRHGQLVTREELHEQIWGNETFVDFEQGMNQCIKQIRNALGDSAGTPRYLETLPRRGYRFIAPVEEVQAAAPELASALEIGPQADSESQSPPGFWANRVRVIVASTFILLLLVTAGVFWRVRRHNYDSIAVLPFANMSPEQSQEYFSDGLSEEVLNALANVPSLRVTGRVSSFQFKGRNEDLRSIGKKLNVATILEGSVRRQGNRVRIAVQLIDCRNGFHLWSQTFEKETTDLLAVQEEVATAVRRELNARLLPSSNSSTKTTNPEAYDAYLQGMYLLDRRSKYNLQKAVDYFTRATSLDPAFAQAWVGLGQARLGQADWDYVPEEEGYRNALRAVERALQINPRLASAYAVMGSIRMNHDWNWTEADACYRRALALEPMNSLVIRLGGQLAWIFGRLDEAVASYRKAIGIDPLNPSLYLNEGILLHYAGRQPEAQETFEKVLELAPETEFAHAFLCRVRLARSEPQQSLMEAHKEKHAVFRLQSLALAYSALGRNDEAKAALNELITKFRENPYEIAGVFAFRGDKDQAFKWLERAYVERDPGLIETKRDPLLKNIAADPRYTELLKKMRLPL